MAGGGPGGAGGGGVGGGPPGLGDLAGGLAGRANSLRPPGDLKNVEGGDKGFSDSEVCGRLQQDVKEIP